VIYVDWVEHVAAAIARLTADSGWVVQAGAILDAVDVTDETTMAVLGRSRPRHAATQIHVDHVSPPALFVVQHHRVVTGNAENRSGQTSSNIGCRHTSIHRMSCGRRSTTTTATYSSVGTASVCR